MLKPACNVGLFVLSSGNILVFGGKSLTGSLKDVYYFGVRQNAVQQDANLELENEDSFPNTPITMMLPGQGGSQYVVG